MNCQEKIKKIAERNKRFAEQKKLSLVDFFNLPEFDEYKERQREISENIILVKSYKAIKPCNIKINNCYKNNNILTDFTGGI